MLIGLNILKDKKYISYFLALLAGLLYGLAFLPLTHSRDALAQANDLHLSTVLAILGLMLWLYSIVGQNRRQVWLLTLVFGLSSYALAASWVYISIHTFGQSPAWLAFGLTLLFIVALALIQALPWLCYPRTISFAVNSGPFAPHPTDAVKAVKSLGRKPLTLSAALYLALIAAILWLCSELLLTYVGTGFPWLLPGYVIDIHHLRQGWLPLIGVHGFDALLIFILQLWVIIVRYDIPLHGRHPATITKSISSSIPYLKSRLLLTTLTLLITVGFIGGAKLLIKPWTKPMPQAHQLLLVQGAIAQTLKWDSDYLLMILQRYYDLSRHAPAGTIVIWPEGAIPAFNTQVQPFLDDLQQQAHQKSLAFIVGLPWVKQEDYYNAMLALSASSPQVYAKRHLVPFGEYLPFERQLRGFINFFDLPMSDFKAGARGQVPLRVQGINVGGLICYEVAYLSLVAQTAINSNILIALSDDTWFGRSAAAWQQLQISRTRAIETALPMILVGNDGYTGWINQHGQVVTLLPRYEVGTLSLNITPRTGTTPITKAYAWL